MKIQIVLIGASLLGLPDISRASSLYPDEPSGFSQLVRHTFSDKTNNGACNDYYPGGGSQLLSDPSEPVSPSGFLRMIKPAGQAHGGTVIDCLFSPQRNIFWGMTIRPSNPFGGYNNGANKIGFMISNRPTGGGGLWGLHYRGSTNGSRVVAVFLQASTGVSNCHIPEIDGDCNGSSLVFYPNINGSPVSEGVFHRVEITMRRSTTESSRDGVMRVVVDGSLRIYHTDLNTPAWDFISVMNNHTWDGQCAQRNPNVGPTTPPNDCRPFDDWYDFGDWYVSGGSGGSNPVPVGPSPLAKPVNLKILN